MLRDAITFPVRVGLVATRVGLRLTERAVILGVRTTERLIKGVLLPQSPSAVQRSDSAHAVQLGVVIATPAARKPPQPATEARPNGRAAGTGPAAATRSGPLAPIEAPLPEPPPAHLSTEPAFVESFAEAGAEEGAGATVHIDEPWAGYAQMSANDVIARLRGASPEELAVVELYEGVHRRRKTVLAAAQRELGRPRSKAAARQGRSTPDDASMTERA